MFCTLRTRLQCEVYRGDTRLATAQAFNEACLDRGLGLNFLQMECYIDGSFVTTIQVGLDSLCPFHFVFQEPADGVLYRRQLHDNHL